jgi:hypothetical protein
METEAASILFLKWSSIYEKEKPFQIFTDLLPDAQDRRKDNLAWDVKNILVEDIRDREDEFQLDTSGFTTIQLPGFTNLTDHETIVKQYIPAVRKVVEEKLQGARTILVMDWRVECPPHSTNLFQC